MAVSAACPSCGAPVVFKSASSVFAVCEYCQSTLVRHDQALEDIGKMAALAEDRSPLQLGSEGSWQGLHFALIGRIQLKYSQGLWNEWHLMFDDMRTGWLSEANGEYVVSFVHPVQEPLPAFESLEPGGRITIASRAWTVTDIEEAECIAGQGELPFKVGAGYKAPVADLRCGENFATLDYSETPPLLFVGAPVPFKSLKLSNLRQGAPLPTHTVEAQVFRCPSCGAPMQARSKDILAVGCGSCGAVVDTADENHRILSKALGNRDEKYIPRLPVGTKGNLAGAPVEVIGFLVRQTVAEGVAYDWREYLLAGENGTYRWLAEYDGHWNVVDVLSAQPVGGKDQADVVYEGNRYRHFSTCKATVIQVEGEFNWRVKRGDSCAVADFVAPPLMLSRERTEREVTWSLGRYIAPEEIQASFKLPNRLPEPVGVYANQPNGWEEPHRRVCSAFWKMALAALVVQLFFNFIAGGHRLLQQTVTFSARGQQDDIATQTFELKSKAHSLVVSNHARLNNNWLSLDLALVNKVTGEAWPANREMAYYYGVEDGENWTEGNRDDSVVFRDVPPGTYYLTIDPDIGTDNLETIEDTVEVRSGKAAWLNCVLVCIFLIGFPIFTRLRREAFEVRRWAESDHAPISSDDSDDD